MGTIKNLTIDYQEKVGILIEDVISADSDAFVKDLIQLLLIALNIYSTAIQSQNRVLISMANTVLKNTTQIVIGMGEIVQQEQFDMESTQTIVLPILRKIKLPKIYN